MTYASHYLALRPKRTRIRWQMDVALDGEDGIIRAYRTSRPKAPV